MHMKQIILICCCAVILNSADLYGQCGEEYHSNLSGDAWTSCSKSSNPNPIRPLSHWLKYDFGYLYELSTTHIWNYNAENHTDKGMKDLIIDYSEDGQTWFELGTYSIEEASGSQQYTGIEGPDFAGITARYVLFTFLSNWGDPNCSGLSEVRFDVISVLDIDDEFSEESLVFKIHPNPAAEIIWIDFDRSKLKYLEIYNSSSHLMSHKDVSEFNGYLDIHFLAEGVYLVRIADTDDNLYTQKLVKL
jgi:hypothetical protein